MSVLVTREANTSTMRLFGWLFSAYLGSVEDILLQVVLCKIINKLRGSSEVFSVVVCVRVCV